MSPTTSRNLLLYTTVSSIWATVFGFVGPFYVLQIEKLSGGMEKLGIAFSIMVLLQSTTTYVAGRFSDKLGRKPFLLATAYIDAVAVFMYTVITETYELYILQAVLGITNGIVGTIETSLLGDWTVKEKRGAVVGRFHAFVSFFAAIGLSLSGYFVKHYGLTPLFYVASGTVAVSAILLFFIKEERGTPHAGALGASSQAPASGVIPGEGSAVINDPS